MSVTISNEKIAPEYFGQDSGLYGCYHLSADFQSSPSVVICQPTGHEYERCHRAMRQLAVQSARKGLSVMRFDYYATGDSAGACEQLSLPRMQQDIQSAVKACCAKTGTEQLTLVGLRLGATLAAQVAGASNNIESLVLYAPVFDGESLLADWQSEQHSFNGKHSHDQQQTSKAEVLGFSVSEAFQQELATQLSLQVSSTSLKRVLILVDAAEMESELLNSWLETLKHKGIEITLESVDNIAIWRREPMEAIVPAKTIRRIVKWMIEAQYAG